MTLVSPAQTTQTMAQAAVSPSTPAPPAPQLVANGRPVNRGFNFYPSAAGIGDQQFDKIGFDRVGPSSQGHAETELQRDGNWLTTINVPYGVHLGGEAEVNGETDRYTKLSFTSKQQPTLNGDGRLFISGREISGEFLERKLAELNLPPPDFRNFTYGGDAPE
jgi:hypothetical protein